MRLESKLPRVGTTIFSVMSQLATQYGAVNLGQGFPDFDGPPELRENYGFSARDLTLIAREISAHLEHLLTQWSAIHGY